MEISRRVQIAFLGEVPSTLRFVYARVDGDTIHLDAVFTDEAAEDHLECARVAFTEVIAGYSIGTKVVERIERNSHITWRRHEGHHLMYLRHGELSDT